MLPHFFPSLDRFLCQVLLSAATLASPDNKSITQMSRTLPELVGIFSARTSILGFIPCSCLQGPVFVSIQVWMWARLLLSLGRMEMGLEILALENDSSGIRASPFLWQTFIKTLGAQSSNYLGPGHCMLSRSEQWCVYEGIFLSPWWCANLIDAVLLSEIKNLQVPRRDFASLCSFKI